MQPSEQLAQRFLERHPESAAAILSGLAPPQLAQTLGALDAPAAAALAQRLPVAAVARCLDPLGPGQAAALLAALPVQLAADVLRRLAEAAREPFLAALPPAAASAVRAAIDHVQDSIAALMDSQVRSFTLDGTVEEVLHHLEQAAGVSECHIYLTDAGGRFAGRLPFHALIARHPHSRLGSLPVQAMAALPAGARSSNVVGHPAWQRFTQLPVVDPAGRLVGVLRRERLSDRGAATAAREHQGDVLGAGLSLVEGYAAANAVLVELLTQGGGFRR